MCDPEEKDDEFEIVDEYVGEETTIYYDVDGKQHVVVNDKDDD
jgi:hypothetical protein